MIRRNASGQFLTERLNFMMPGAVRHREVRGIRFPAEGHTFHFDECRLAEGDELSVPYVEIEFRAPHAIDAMLSP